MKRSLIANIKIDEQNKIQGFVENIRDKSKFAFLVISDVTGKVQVFVDKMANPDLAEAVSKLTLQSVVTIEGKAVSNPGVKLNGMELVCEKIEIESTAEALPIKSDSAIDLRMDYRWLDLRTEQNLLIFKVQTDLVRYMREYLYSQDFMEIHTPKLIGTASESGSEVFEVKYFDRAAYLAQSPQFYKQMAMAGGFERIFEIGPVFRAEKSYTNRHTTEFTSFDLEISYIESFHDVMSVEEDIIIYAFEKIREKYNQQVMDMFGKEIVVPKKPFPVLTLDELYAVLEEKYNFVMPEDEKGDLSTEAENLCYKYTMETYGHEFLFVTDFGAEKRAFYHMRKDGVPQGYDLIWRGVEITTGAQREHNYDVLKAQADEKGLGEDVAFYLEFFKYGCPPHGGFAIGVDRLTMLLLGIHIKDAMFLFRGPNRLHP